MTEAAGESQVVIKMQGTPRGERVWFDPKGIAVDPGTTITFVNQDPGNSHTVDWDSSALRAGGVSGHVATQFPSIRDIVNES